MGCLEVLIGCLYSSVLTMRLMNDYYNDAEDKGRYFNHLFT